MPEVVVRASEWSLPGLDNWIEVVPMIPIGVMVMGVDEAGETLRNDKKNVRTLAYDGERDVGRYQELVGLFGEMEARRLLLEEMTQDLLTHFAELGGAEGRILSYSWKYQINNQGELVEDTQAKKPIKEMFKSQSDTASRLWREYFIPALEVMPAGSTAVTLSARQDEGEYEGVYDFVYVFQKVDQETILAYGLGLDLSLRNKVQMVNSQVKQTENYWLLMVPEATSEEIRGRGFIYPPGWFETPFKAYEQLLERVGMGNLSDKNVEETFDKASGELAGKRSWLEPLAYSMVERISQGDTTKELLKLSQVEQLWRYDPLMMEDLRKRGAAGVMLPCGWVDLDFSLWPTVGDGLISMQVGNECVQKKCRRCGNTEIADTDTKCRKCSWAPGDSV